MKKIIVISLFVLIFGFAGCDLFQTGPVKEQIKEQEQELEQAGGQQGAQEQEQEQEQEVMVEGAAGGDIMVGGDREEGAESENVDEGDFGDAVEEAGAEDGNEGSVVTDESEKMPTAEASTGSGMLSKEVILAKCLTDKGTKLYTAYWCGHCANQKAAFEDGAIYLDNIECAGESGFTAECRAAGISAVPTWVFGDGTVLSGARPLADLADIGGCVY